MKTIEASFKTGLAAAPFSVELLVLNQPYKDMVFKTKRWATGRLAIKWRQKYGAYYAELGTKEVKQPGHLASAVFLADGLILVDLSIDQVGNKKFSLFPGPLSVPAPPSVFLGAEDLFKAIPNGNTERYEEFYIYLRKSPNQDWFFEHIDWHDHERHAKALAELDPILNDRNLWSSLVGGLHG